MNPQNKQIPRIGVGYVRESTEGQDLGYSPKRQENMIKRYAKEHEIHLIEFYKDLQSGTSVKKREDFQRMIDDALQKKFEIILVFHTSRFARNIKESRHYKQLLRQKLGIDVISVTQYFGEDWQDPSSFLNEGINELFDEHYSRQLSFWMRHALAEKRRKGFSTGRPSLGYCKKKGDTRNWYVHKQEAKTVKEIFELYATGKYSFADISAKLNSKGYKTKLGNDFTYSSLKDIVSNRSYLGLIPSGRKGFPEIHGSHEPIITEGLFEKCQEVRSFRRNTIGRPVAKHRFYLLKGLLYCYNCIERLKGKEDKAGNTALMPKMYCETRVWEKSNGKKIERYHYGCKFKRENKSCKQPNVQTKVIDKQVIKLMEGLELPDYIITAVIDKLRNLFSKAKLSVKENKEIKKLEKERERVNTMYRIGEYSDEQYKQEITIIKNNLKEHQALNRVANKSKLDEEKYLRETEAFLRDFKGFWKPLAATEKRDWIQMVFKRIWVKGQKVVAVEPHDDFKPLLVSLKKFLVQSPPLTPTAQ
ncbi:recombinase family protein [Patescibacteria group bacterium]|nr:recombinase family protein [Patescibacteria group bacterium]